MKELLADENKLYRLSFDECNVDRIWGRVVFSGESNFSSTNDRPVLVYRPKGERYNSQYVMVPSLRMLYPDGIINFQQKHSSIYDSHVVQE